MLQCTPDDPHWSEDPWYFIWGFFVSDQSPYWSLIFSVDPPSIFFDLAPVHQLSIKWLCITPLWFLEASLAPIWLPAFRIFGFLLHSWLTPLPIKLTDELTHCFTQQLINPSYAYSYMLIPCLPTNYKAPIVLLPIPYKFCLLPFFLYL